jgi:hypothetical protein
MLSQHKMTKPIARMAIRVCLEPLVGDREKDNRTVHPTRRRAVLCYSTSSCKVKQSPHGGKVMFNWFMFDCGYIAIYYCDAEVRRSIILDSLLCVECRRHAIAAASCLGATCGTEGRISKAPASSLCRVQRISLTGRLPMLRKDKPVEHTHPNDKTSSDSRR